MTDTVVTNVTNGCPEMDTPPPSGLLVDPAVVELRQQVAVLAWLHAELAYRQLRVATMVATMMAEKIAPQIQKTLLAQLTGGG